MVKLIASDLDGTLLQNGARDVNPIVFDQIRTLKEHGILFAAASGRQYLNLRRLFTPVQDDIAYIAENGSLCIYNEETISKGIIEQDLAYSILDEVSRYPQYNCIISGDKNTGSIQRTGTQTTSFIILHHHTRGVSIDRAYKISPSFWANAPKGRMQKCRAVHRPSGIAFFFTSYCGTPAVRSGSRGSGCRRPQWW